MLINMKEMLTVAKENKFAVPAFNIGDGNFLKLVIEECEALNSPVILAIHPDEIGYIGQQLSMHAVQVAKEATIPVVVHMDHGSCIEDIMVAIRCGYTSVMIDASHNSFEENVEITKQVVKLCHPLNISVEAELGTIGNNDGSFEGTTKDIFYTKPQDVLAFIEQTKCDTLAIAIGTAHGLYPADMKPELRLDILTEIANVTTAPLVLHGGSNNNDVEIAQAVKIGVQKINISSDMKSAFFKSTTEALVANKWYEPHMVYAEPIRSAKAVIKNKLELFNTVDMAKEYRNNN